MCKIDSRPLTWERSRWVVGCFFLGSTDRATDKHGIAVIRGYCNYYGVIGNYASLVQFFKQVIRILLKWLNRRSLRRSYNWQGFDQLLKHYRIERPRIVGRPRTRKLQLL